MASIVACACGARVRVPEEAAGRAFRCPRCKADLVTTVDAKVLSSFTARAGADAVCPICQAAVAAGEAAVTCPECDQVHHRECWMEVGGCSTYGCPQAPAAAKEAPPADRPRSAWGDTKVCPACGETIKSIALRCRYCDTDFDTVDPLKPADLRKGKRKQATLRNLRTTVTILFIVSLLGCTAPVVVLLSFVLLLPKRQLLPRAGPLYVVLAYSTMALSMLYFVLMLVFMFVQIFSE